MTQPNLSGILHLDPQYVRVVALGKCMILDINRQGVWEPADGSVLVPDMQTAQAILVGHGFEVDTTVPIEPGLFYVRKMVVKDPPVGVSPEVEGGDARVAPLPTSALAPDPLPPELQGVLPLLAASLPTSQEGDMIDVNRLHLAWNAWQWVVANREALRPFLYPGPTAAFVDDPTPAKRGRSRPPNRR